VLRRALSAVGLLVATWIAISLVLFVWSPWAAGAPKHADAVIVLSGGRERLPPAMALIRRNVAPVLAISSVSHTRPWPLAERLCGAGRYAGARVICFEASPYSTRGEAEAVGRLARARGWTDLVVVTSRFHVTRARMLFRRCYSGKLSMLAVPSTWWKLPLDWADETGKLLVQLTAQRAC
jgi:uncharacterized SAM-binding protein YcdF (DUF218 family)